ncbi:MAG TPA: hypothetical protein VL361_12580 [Candidatus Limnocylindrales bacterium]|nr:hypothetical protein [Candidatus Limnocylindrales bacterium]
MKPTSLSLWALLASASITPAQTNSPLQDPADQTTQTTTTQTNSASRMDPTEVVQKQLKKADIDVPISYRTNGNLVFCTVRCKDLEQRNAVYDTFSSMAKYGLSATKTPPTVTVVVLSDAAKYFSEQQNQKLVAKLQKSETNIVGHVLQKIPEGLLVTLPDSQVVLVADAPNLSDGDPIQVTAFAIGTLELIDKSGARKFIRKYTCNLAAATDHWTPLATSEAKTETQKRTDLPE